MDQQWTAYPADAPPASRPRYNMAAPQAAPRDAGGSSQQPTPDSYASPAAPSRQSTLGSIQPHDDGDGDVAMEDADPYKPKYGGMSRPNHQHRHSQQFLQQEESAASRRYSPMNLSPTSPYPGTTQQGTPSYASFAPVSQPQSNRQSPTRTNPYMSPHNSYYSPPCTSRPPAGSILAPPY
jgi:dual specificity protein kinase YAK1